MKIAKLILNINRIRLIQFLFFSIIVLMVSYVYLINTVTFKIAQKSQISQQISLINSEIADLEAELFEKRKSINYSLTQEMGLVQNVEDDTIFVLRGDNTRLTFNE